MSLGTKGPRLGEASVSLSARHESREYGSCFIYKLALLENGFSLHFRSYLLARVRFIIPLIVIIKNTLFPLP